MIGNKKVKKRKVKGKRGESQASKQSKTTNTKRNSTGAGTKSQQQLTTSKKNEERKKCAGRPQRLVVGVNRWKTAATGTLRTAVFISLLQCWFSVIVSKMHFCFLRSKNLCFFIFFVFYCCGSGALYAYSALLCITNWLFTK